jgi:hypothetical protein
MSGASNRGAQPSLLGGWFSGALDAVERERQAAEAAGREVYEKALRAGQNVQARTRAELIALGRSKLAQDAAVVLNGATRAARNPETWQEPARQADTAVRRFNNTILQGAANPIAAGADAVTGAVLAGDLSSVPQRYQSDMQEQEEREAYDLQHRRAASFAGGLAADIALYKGIGRRAAEWASGLSPKRKGQLGEDLSAIKTVLRGDWPSGAHEPVPVSGGRTYVDIPTVRGGLTESKFGPFARLRPRQREAQQEYGDRYRVDQWTPKHVGHIAGGAAAANWPFGPWSFEQPDDDRNEP